MPELQSFLDSAVFAYKRALEFDGGHDSIAYREACGKFKVFLMEAAELGIRVWTRFDTVGMFVGGSILFASVMLVSWYLVTFALECINTLPRDQMLEVALACVFILFYCVLLTFSNSYIDAEEHIGVFLQAVLCIILSVRMSSAPRRPRNGGKLSAIVPWLPLVIPLFSRLALLFVSGHGLDPSIPLHGAHNTAVFLSSLTALALVRANIHDRQNCTSIIHTCLDMAVLLLLALVWVEKRASDTARNGYMLCQTTLALLAVGIVLSVRDVASNNNRDPIANKVSVRVSILLFRLLTAIMAVTGPSAATSVCLFLVQALVLQRLAELSGPLEVRRCPFCDCICGMNLTKHHILLLVVDFGSSIGFLVETVDPTHVFLDQPLLRIQSLAVFSRIRSNRPVLLCHWRHIALSQYVWMGACRLDCRVNKCLSGSTAVCVENVLLLPIVRDSWILCVCEYISTAPHGMGHLCTAIHFRWYLSRTE